MDPSSSDIDNVLGSVNQFVKSRMHGVPPPDLDLLITLRIMKQDSLTVHVVSKSSEDTLVIQPLIQRQK